MTEWKTYRLGDIASFSQGIQVDIDKQLPYKKGGYVRFIRIVDFTKANEPYRYIETPKKQYLTNSGDIVMIRYGSQTAGLVVKSFEGAIANNMFKITLDEQVVDRDFIYYALSQEDIFSSLRNAQSSSTMPAITFEIASRIQLKIPSLEEQRRIAGILGAIDDKIENNRRINDNLEQQAQAIFKSWFVDFEPFKDGNFVSSELGMIPDGWKVGKLGDLCQFKRGKGLLSKNAIPGNVPVVAGGVEPSCYHNVSNTKSPVVTISGSGANAGFMRMYHQEVWASDCSFIDSSCRNFLFVYCFLATNQKLLKHAQTGAVQPHVKPSDIHNFDIIVPTFEIIDEFQNLISDFIMAKGNNQQEISRLATLRDTLLPKLMSGELIL